MINSNTTKSEQTTTTSVVTKEDPNQISHEVTLYAEPVTHVGEFTITNALVTSWAAVFIIILLSIALCKGLKSVPNKLQQLFEVVYTGGLDLCDQVTGNRSKSRKVFPLVISIFFFVLVNNWIGILPLGGFGLVEHGAEGLAFIPFVRSGTADINTTLALAIMSVIGANLFGITSIGLWKMFNKYVNLTTLAGIPKKVKSDPMVLVVAPVTFFVGLLEIIGEFAKVASLSFRLFGNVFAGEVLLASMAALLAYVLPVPFLFLEILVGVIQAFIFAMLTLVYFSVASEDHSEHEEHKVEHAHALQEVSGGQA